MGDGIGGAVGVMEAAGPIGVPVGALGGRLGAAIGGVIWIAGAGVAVVDVSCGGTLTGG
jgi:hypothetical protein